MMNAATVAIDCVARLDMRTSLSPPRFYRGTSAAAMAVRGGADHINDAFGTDRNAVRPLRERLPGQTYSVRPRAGAGGEGSTIVLARLVGLRAVAALAFVAPALCVPAGSAHAQGRLDARYVVTLAGLPIGRGNWTIDIGDDQYVATASGKTTGLLRMIANGEGISAARGRVSHGNLVPATYASTIKTDTYTEDMRITLAAGNVKELSIEPPSPPQPDRLPVSEAQRRGVMDPMSSTLNYVVGSGQLLAPAACNYKVSVFDGRMRYDLKLAYKRMDTVRADKGYAGPAVVCSLYFVPIAGYIPTRRAIKYLVAQRDMESWLVPIAGTRLMAPFRVTIPTPLGMGVLEATEFVTAAVPSHASAANTRTP
jgi:hypothetical protein